MLTVLLPVPNYCPNAAPENMARFLLFLPKTGAWTVRFCSKGLRVAPMAVRHGGRARRLELPCQRCVAGKLISKSVK